MTTKAAQWSDFSRGDWGLLSPWSAPPGSWSGVNMLRYLDGTLGPRPGWYDVTPSGASAGVIVHDLGYVPGGIGGNGVVTAVWAAVCNAGTSTGAVFGWDYSQATGAAAQAYSGSYSKAASGGLYAQHVDWGINSASPVSYLWVDGACYKVSHLGKTVAAVSLATAPATVGKLPFLHQGRQCYIGQTNGYYRRLVFSRTLSPEDFVNVVNDPTSGGFVDIGDAANIVAVVVMRDRVYCFTDTNQVWVVTGTFGVSTTVRLVTVTACPVTQDAAAVIGDNEVWLYPGVKPNPKRFDGVGAMLLDTLDFSTMSLFRAAGIYGSVSQPGHQVSPLTKDTELGFLPRGVGSPANQTALLRMRGAWTKWTIPAASTDKSRRWLAVPDGLIEARLTSGSAFSARIIQTDPTTPGIAATVGQNIDDAGSSLAAQVSLPAVIASPSMHMAPRKAWVDLLYVANGGSAGTAPQLTLTVTGYDFEGGSAVGAKSVALLPTVDGRYYLDCSTLGWCGAVVVSLTGVVGVKVKRVAMLYDEDVMP